MQYQWLLWHIFCWEINEPKTCLNPSGNAFFWRYQEARWWNRYLIPGKWKGDNQNEHYSKYVVIMSLLSSVNFLTCKKKAFFLSSPSMFWLISCTASRSTNAKIVYHGFKRKFCFFLKKHISIFFLIHKEQLEIFINFSCCSNSSYWIIS